MKWLWIFLLVLCAIALVVSFIRDGELNEIVLIWANIAFLWINVTLLEERLKK